MKTAILFLSVILTACGGGAGEDVYNEKDTTALNKLPKACVIIKQHADVWEAQFGRPVLSFTDCSTNIWNIYNTYPSLLPDADEAYVTITYKNNSYEGIRSEGAQVLPAQLSRLLVLDYKQTDAIAKYEYCIWREKIITPGTWKVISAGYYTFTGREVERVKVDCIEGEVILQ